MHFTNTIASAALLAAVPPVASANVFDVFDNRTDWLAATSGPVVTESFEGPDSLGLLDAPSIFGTGLGVAATDQAASTSAVQAGFANTTNGGSQYVQFGGFDSTGDYTMQFLLPQSTSAFGFDIVDWEPGLITVGPQAASVQLRNNGSLVIGFSLASTNDVSEAIAFIGFASDTFVFDEVRFTVNEILGQNSGLQILDRTGVDEVAWVVPAPSSAIALGIAGLLGCRRRR